MREVKIYRFSELDAEQQKKTIACNMPIIENEVCNYMTDIWPDYVAELSEDLFSVDCVFLVTVSNERIAIIIDYSKMPFMLDDVRVVLADLVDKYADEHKWFREEILEIANKYLAMQFPTFEGFVSELRGVIETNANNFYVNMLHNTDYVYNYVNGKLNKSSYYIVEDFLDNNYEFLEDGRIYED